jgi:hypothetical protein
MVGLVPTIHISLGRGRVQDVDARHKAGHDAKVGCDVGYARSDFS